MMSAPAERFSRPWISSVLPPSFTMIGSLMANVPPFLAAIVTVFLYSSFGFLVSRRSRFSESIVPLIVLAEMETFERPLACTFFPSSVSVSASIVPSSPARIIFPFMETSLPLMENVSAVFDLMEEVLVSSNSSPPSRWMLFPVSAIFDRPPERTTESWTVRDSVFSSPTTVSARSLFVPSPFISIVLARIVSLDSCRFETLFALMKSFAFSVISVSSNPETLLIVMEFASTEMMLSPDLVWISPTR